MVNDILNDPEMEELLDSRGDASGKIVNQVITSDLDAPSTERIYTDLPEPDKLDILPLRERACY